MESFINVCNGIYHELLGYINTDTVRTILLIILIYTLFMYIIFNISFFFLLKKEHRNPYHALIPFYNLFMYFELIEQSVWLLIIPIINIFALFTSPYNLCKTYRLKEWMADLSILVPFIFLPYVAFSNAKRRNRIINQPFLRNNKELNALEDSLIARSNDETIETAQNNYNDTKSNYESSIDRKINEVEENAVMTDYLDELSLLEVKEQDKSVEATKENDENSDIEVITDESEMLDKFETNNTDDLRTFGVDNLEEKIIDNTEKKIIDTSEQEEYKGASVEASTIAFGGTEVDVKIEEAKTDAKELDLECPYCKSHLDGSNGICPGCGRDVHEYVFEVINKEKTSS